MKDRCGKTFGWSMTTPVISVNGLGKQFRLNKTDRTFKLKHLLTNWQFKRKKYDTFWCLQDVTFQVAPGQMIGIIGANGSGKSTLLRLVGGVGRPDRGSLSVRGRLGALLDLGAGFHNDLSGRDNIFISGVIAGLTRRQVSMRFDRIVPFAGIENFLDNPLRTYSSGMRMRLAFAVATNIDADILLIDEILSVGDLAFQSKCLEKIDEFKQSGCTILLVSHDNVQVEKFCDSVLWLKNGKVQAYGAPGEVVKAYSENMACETRKRTPLQPGGFGNGLKLNENRFGSLEIEISAVRIRNAYGRQTQSINSAEPVKIELDYESHVKADAPIFGVTISKEDGQICCEMVLDQNRFELEGFHQNGTMVLDIDRLDLNGGRYFVDVGVYEKSWDYAYDYHWHAYPLNIGSKSVHKGILAPPHKWTWLMN